MVHTKSMFPSPANFESLPQSDQDVVLAHIQEHLNFSVDEHGQWTVSIPLPMDEPHMSARYRSMVLRNNKYADRHLPGLILQRSGIQRPSYRMLYNFAHHICNDCGCAKEVVEAENDHINFECLAISHFDSDRIL